MSSRWLSSPWYVVRLAIVPVVSSRWKSSRRMSSPWHDTRENDRPCRCQLQEAGSGATPAQPPPAAHTPRDQAAATNNGASGHSGSSEVLVLGDSITYALSTNGLRKLCNDRSIAIQSTSGAVPATLETHGQTLWSTSGLTALTTVPTTLSMALRWISLRTLSSMRSASETLTHKQQYTSRQLSNELI